MRQASAPAGGTLLVACAVLLTATALSSSPVNAQAGEEPGLFLAWHAPYGAPRARDYLTRTCGDTSATDTLYLSYRLSEEHDAFTGILGTLLFQPQFSDSLRSEWLTESNNPGFLQCEFPSDTADVFNAGWRAPGMGAWRYYGHASQGMVRLIYAVPATHAQPVFPGLYCFARVIVNRPPSGEGCDEGMCVEFRGAKFSFSVNAPSRLGVQSRASFASINSPSGLACSKYRRMAETRRQEVLAKRAAAKARPRPGAAAVTDSAGASPE